ncbi:MAG TPA: TetR/AcrR family transcriptional regulator [Chondromyces sp.]|nr:TetR/AcrR family transcriptional regulator [Chondromyces sp.]
MPKFTFLNLPEEKKQTLIQAAKKEFSRAPLFKASITNIIKTAGIPRGSFYQYFEDKEDLFFYLLNELAKENKQKFISLLEKNQGDLFDTMVEFFRLVIQEEENFNFLKHTFLNMTYKIEHTFERSFSHHETDENYKELSSLINKSNLNITGDKELFYVMQIVITVTFRNFVEKFAKELSVEKAMNNYLIELNLLKRGLLK